MTARAALDGDYRARQTVAALITEMLEAACSPTSIPCVLVLDTGLNILARKYSEDLTQISRDVHALRHTAPDLLRSCFKFIMYPRTDQQKAEMFRQGKEIGLICHCDTGNSRLLHDLHHPEALGMVRPPDDFSEGLHFLLSDILMLAEYALKDLSPGSSAWPRGMKRLRYRFREARCYETVRGWPVMELDIAPYGLEISLTNLCAWQQQYPHEPRFVEISNIVFYLLGDYSSTNTIFSSVICYGLFGILTNVVNQWQRHDERSNLEALRLLLNQVIIPMHFVNALDSGRFALFARRLDIPWTDLIELCCSAREVLCNLEIFVAQTARRLEDSDHFQSVLESITESKAQLYTFAALIHHTLRLPYDESVYSPMIIAGSQSFSKLNTPARSLASFVSNLYYGYVCGNPTCTEVFSTGNCGLLVCSGCRHMFYCSRRCQKQAWKYPKAAHRNICGALKDITDRVGLDKKAATLFRFIQRCTETGADDETMTRIVENLVVVYSR